MFPKKCVRYVVIIIMCRCDGIGGGPSGCDDLFANTCELVYIYMNVVFLDLNQLDGHIRFGPQYMTVKHCAGLINLELEIGQQHQQPQQKQL